MVLRRRIELLIATAASLVIVQAMWHRMLNSAFMDAALRGDVEVVRLLLDRGADVNVRYSNLRTPHVPMVCGGCVHVDWMHGGTALMYAAVHARTPLVRLLLDRGADVGAKNASGRTALMFAGAGGGGLLAPRVIVALLSAGADVRAADEDVLTPRGWAQGMLNARDVVRLLEGADAGRQGDQSGRRRPR
jgi:ankyrin repeat protein